MSDPRENEPAVRYRLYCIMAKDSIDKMKGVRGKMITQGGHGYLHSFWDAERRFPEHARAYQQSSHAYKITLVVPTTDDLLPLLDAYRDVCGVSLVKDAGFTVFEEPTVTCLGIGPIPENLIGDDLKALKTLT
jgi:peptidyl-tRNA hydrolase